ncbi:collagen alpha-1(I) chain-like isoform X1 [Agelaius tricolor]|uniref:collagen alpha-1(I) chain-like isoform X1 n=2 Tax=Agelaius tricolor TaxID=9191 RepID=UPI0039F22C48
MFLLPPRGNLRIFLGSFLGFLGLFGSGGNRNRAGAGPGRGRGRGRNLGSEKKNLGSEKENLGSGFLGPFQGRPMALQETYGNWLGPGRLQRQPGIYSAPRTMPPPGDFRPASPDSFEDDYDDVSMAGSEQGPQPKGLYLLAGAPGSSPAPSLPDPEAKIADSHPKIAGSDPKFRNSDPKFRNSAPKFGISDPKIGDFDPKSGDFAPKLGDLAPKRRGRAALGALALLGLAWAAALGLGLGKYLELREELELLRANFSRIWDSAGSDRAPFRDPAAPTGAAGARCTAVPGPGQLPALWARLAPTRLQLFLVLPGRSELGPGPQRLRGPGRAPGGDQRAGGAALPAGAQQPQQLLLAGAEGPAAGGAMALAHGRGAHRDVLGRVAAGGAAGARGLRGPGAQGALGEREVLGAAALGVPETQPLLKPGLGAKIGVLLMGFV